MCNKIRALAVATVGALWVVPVHAGEQIDEASAAIMNAVSQAARSAVTKADVPGWLSRTDISVDIQNKHKPSWAIETIQPLYQGEDLGHTLFVQGRLAHSDGDETLNLGVGYRFLLPDETWLLGVNTWYDTTNKQSHYRYGLGLEALGQYTDLRFNLYDAQSGEKIISTVGGVSNAEQALDGWDFGIEAPLPYLPWARISFSTFEWDRSTARNIKGNTLGVKMALTDNMEVEFGGTDDNTGNTQAFMTVSWFFERPHGTEWTAFGSGRSSTAFVARDLKRHTLDKVRRHHDIVIEKKVSGGAGIAVGRRN